MEIRWNLNKAIEGIEITSHVDPEPQLRAITSNTAVEDGT